MSCHVTQVSVLCARRWWQCLHAQDPRPRQLRGLRHREGEYHSTFYIHDIYVLAVPAVTIYWTISVLFRQCLVFDKYPKVLHKIVVFWVKELLSKFFLSECFIVIFIQLIPLLLDVLVHWRIKLLHESFLCQAALLQPIFGHQQSVWGVIFINKHVSPNIFPVPYPQTCKWCLMFDVWQYCTVCRFEIRYNLSVFTDLLQL